MQTQEWIDRVRESLSAKYVYAEPIHQGDAIIIPAARIRGGAGGGEGRQEKGAGSGAGFGLNATPAGAFIVRDGRVQWKPAVEVNRIVLGAQIVAALAIWMLGRLLRVD